MSDHITTTPTPEPTKPTCPECGAEIRIPAATRCWLCQEPLAKATAADMTRQIRRAPVGDSSASQVVAILVLGLLVVLGLMAGQATGVLIGLLILSVPALVRTVVMSSRQRDAGAPAAATSVFFTFLTSLGIVVVVGIASGIAFFATCFVVCLLQLNSSGKGDGILAGSVLAGLVTGFIVFLFLMRALWPRKG